MTSGWSGGLAGVDRLDQLLWIFLKYLFVSQKALDVRSSAQAASGVRSAMFRILRSIKWNLRLAADDEALPAELARTPYSDTILSWMLAPWVVVCLNLMLCGYHETMVKRWVKKTLPTHPDRAMVCGVNVLTKVVDNLVDLGWWDRCLKRPYRRTAGRPLDR